MCERALRCIANTSAKLIAREYFLKFEAAGEEASQFVGGGLGFDLFLKSGEFFFDAAVAEDAQAALGVVPGGLGDWLEENFEKQAPLSFLESRGECGGIGMLADFRDEKFEEAFAFQAAMEGVGNDLAREFFAEAVCFNEHANDLAFGGFYGWAEEAGVWFYFTAAFGGGAAESFAEDGLVNAQLGGHSRGPFGA
jgi:hypothetical protein